MTKELTAEEYLEGQYGTTDITGDVKLTTVIAAKHYGDLRAKEAVAKFARELIAQSETWQNQSGEVDNVVSVDDIKTFAKQHGVNL